MTVLRLALGPSSKVNSGVQMSKLIASGNNTEADVLFPDLFDMNKEGKLRGKSDSSKWSCGERLLATRSLIVFFSSFLSSLASVFLLLRDRYLLPFQQAIVSLRDKTASGKR
jgi:hypothetical protein